MRTWRWALMAAVLAAVPSVPALAQSQITTGVIQGIVVDTSGGVLPGVDVDARNTGTNLRRSAVTTKDGRYVLLQLPSGSYEVTFKLSGFATLVQKDVVVSVGQTVSLTGTMKVSGVAETVTVTTEAPTVES